MSEGIRLLTAICQHGSSEELRQLTPDLFVDEDEEQLYDFIRNHYRRYGRFPSVQTLEDGVAIEIPDLDESLEYYRDKVHERRMFNALREPFGDLRNALSDLNVTRANEVVQEMARSARATSPDQSLLDTGTVFEQVLHDYNRHHERPGFSGVTTGWSSLDEQTGGYQNGDLVVWVARPGMGKTWLLLHQTHAAWMDGKSALFVSMEMTLPQIGTRFASYHAGVDPDCARKGMLSTYAERRFRTSAGTLGNANSLNWFAGGMKKRSEEVDILIQELSPDIVYIDGIYLMQPVGGNSRMGRYEKAAYLVDELKTIAYQRDRPVVVTTQFGRDAGQGGSKGSMENIGYTDAFSTHSSLIFGIKGGKKVRIEELRFPHPYPSRDRQTIVMREARDIYPYREIEILKGREGESGSFGCHYRFGPTNFNEAPLTEVREQSGQEVSALA